VYERVLVPFDFSPDSQHAAACSKYIPNVSHVVLLHVVYTKLPSVSGDFINPEADYARLRLEEYIRGIEIGGLSIRPRIEEITGGNIFDIVNKVAAEENISLTVMGRRGRGVIETILIGSVAHDVLRYGTTDLLLTIRSEKQASGANIPPCSDLFSHVLICTDFSDPDIVTLARERLSQPQRVSIIHVVSHGESEKEVRDLSGSAWSELERLSKEFSSRHVAVTTAIRVGSTSTEIVGYAEKEGVTLIVMKSAGERGVIPSFLGTTAARVARTARVPVLVLKQFDKVRE